MKCDMPCLMARNITAMYIFRVGISVWIYVLIFIAYVNGNCKVFIECLCRPRNLEGEAYLLMWGFLRLTDTVCLHVCLRGSDLLKLELQFYLLKL